MKPDIQHVGITKDREMQSKNSPVKLSSQILPTNMHMWLNTGQGNDTSSNHKYELSFILHLTFFIDMTAGNTFPTSFGFHRPQWTMIDDSMMN